MTILDVNINEQAYTHITTLTHLLNLSINLNSKRNALYSTDHGT